MKRVLIPAALFCTALIIVVTYAVTISLPKRAETHALKTLSTLGFENASIDTQDIRITGARFERIALDAETLSTIERIDITYTPLKLLTANTLDTIKIFGLRLIGELDKQQRITIAGWDQTKAQLNLQQAALNTLTIEDGKIDLLTDTIGGLNLDFDLQARTQNNQTDIQGTLRSQQHYLSAICLLYTSPSPRDQRGSRMPSSA